MGELYKLNFPNGKTYIGIAANGAKERFLVHRRNAMNADQLLYRAWRKYGEPVLQVLAIVEDDLLHETEIKAIAAYVTFSPEGYNLTLGGEGTHGHTHSPETRAKISAAGRLRAESPEWKAKMSAANKGKVVSPETRARMRTAKKNMSPETRAKIGAAKRGQIFSPGALAKMSTAHCNPSPETRAKLSARQEQRMSNPEERKKISELIKRNWDAGVYSRRASTEARAKMSAAARNRSPEARAKISAAQRNRSPEWRANISAAKKAFYAARRKVAS